MDRIEIFVIKMVSGLQPCRVGGGAAIAALLGAGR